MFYELRCFSNFAYFSLLHATPTNNAERLLKVKYLWTNPDTRHFNTLSFLVSLEDKCIGSTCILLYKFSRLCSQLVELEGLCLAASHFHHFHQGSWVTIGYGFHKFVSAVLGGLELSLSWRDVVFIILLVPRLLVSELWWVVFCCHLCLWHSTRPGDITIRYWLDGLLQLISNIESMVAAPFAEYLFSFVKFINVLCFTSLKSIE